MDPSIRDMLILKRTGLTRRRIGFEALRVAEINYPLVKLLAFAREVRTFAWGAVAGFGALDLAAALLIGGAGFALRLSRKAQPIFVRTA